VNCTIYSELTPKKEDNMKKTLLYSLVGLCLIIVGISTGCKLWPLAEALDSPSFSIDSGRYYSEQTVTISSTAEDATIYYTVDGTEPTINSNEYSAPFEIIDSSSIKAITATGDGTSPVSSLEIEIVPPVFPLDFATFFGDKVLVSATSSSRSIDPPTGYLDNMDSPNYYYRLVSPVFVGLADNTFGSSDVVSTDDSFSLGEFHHAEIDVQIERNVTDKTFEFTFSSTYKSEIRSIAFLSIDKDGNFDYQETLYPIWEDDATGQRKYTLTGTIEGTNFTAEGTASAFKNGDFAGVGSGFLEKTDNHYSFKFYFDDMVPKLSEEVTYEDISEIPESEYMPWNGYQQFIKLQETNTFEFRQGNFVEDPLDPDRCVLKESRENLSEISKSANAFYLYNKTENGGFPHLPLEEEIDCLASVIIRENVVGTDIEYEQYDSDSDTWSEIDSDIVETIYSNNGYFHESNDAINWLENS
jgi:hypothetical protein